MTIDKIGIVADQEERRPRLVLRGPQSSREVLESSTTGDIVIEPNGRARAIRHDTIDPDFVGSKLYRHRAGHIDDASLSRGISDAICSSNQTGRGTKIDYLSTSTLLRHLSRDVLRDEIGSLKAHRDDFVE